MLYCMYSRGRGGGCVYSSCISAAIICKENSDNITCRPRAGAHTHTGLLPNGRAPWAIGIGPPQVRNSGFGDLGLVLGL